VEYQKSKEGMNNDTKPITFATRGFSMSSMISGWWLGFSASDVDSIALKGETSNSVE
jgi:hypothetical protein